MKWEAGIEGLINLLADDRQVVPTHGAQARQGQKILAAIATSFLSML